MFQRNPRAPHCGRELGCVRAGQGGFTLIELLVVFAISGLLMALVPLAFGKLRETSQYRDTLRNVMADMRVARQTAQATGTLVRFTLDLSQRQFGIEHQPQRAIPEVLQIRATVGRDLLAANGRATIVFLPDGGATGGNIEIVRPSGSGARVRVDWLTGRVEQEAM